MKARTIYLSVLIAATAITAQAQVIQKRCSTCGRVIAQCPYKGQHKAIAAKSGKATAPTRHAAAPQRLKAPAAPTPVGTPARTVADLLYFPFACLPQSINSKEKAQKALTQQFGLCETINNIYIGLHHSDAYHFTYKGTPIGLCHADLIDDNRTWYSFYFDTRQQADAFCATLSADIKAAGIPLQPDKVYGGLSNRRHPVGMFKWVYVATPQKVTQDDLCCNINLPSTKGQYAVELGVYKH